jgi:hypothetical protein
MLIKNPKLKQKLSLIFPAMAFFIAAWGSVDESDDYIFGSFYLLVGVVNLLLLKYIEKQKLMTNIVVNTLNIIASIVIGIQFYFSGKEYIPYAYFIIAILYLVVTVRFMVKYLRSLRTTT